MLHKLHNKRCFSTEINPFDNNNTSSKKYRLPVLTREGLQYLIYALLVVHRHNVLLLLSKKKHKNVTQRVSYIMNILF